VGHLTTKLLILLAMLSLSSCSFNSVFFPIDERPDDLFDVDVEKVELVSSDGKTIQHYFFKPELPAKATIFVLHGSGSKVINWFKVVKPLVENRYQVFMMEYRGFGSSEGEAHHHSVANDANAALLYLTGRTDVKSKPLLILGQSYGGQLAIYVTHKNQYLVDGLITEGTYTSFSEEAASFSPWPISLFVESIVSNEYESHELIRDIKIHKLFIHSKKDEVVPFNMAKILFNNANGHKELWTLNGKHVTGLIDRPIKYVAKINELLFKVDKKLE
jgi:pimeloyl-ACP methyl ester carboxylesterase